MNNLDLDKILAVILKEIQNETRGWLIGRPCSEEAFLNRLTEVLAKRRKCDVGTTEVYKVEVEQHILHRKGKNQTDKYGSDLAVTISIPDQKFSKTALLQLKKAKIIRLNFCEIKYNKPHNLNRLSKEVLLW